MENIKYHNGFGNTFASEAESGALPLRQNSPQKVPFGLYAEQLSGSAFTALRVHNKRSWQYRLCPSVIHTGDFNEMNSGLIRSSNASELAKTPPTQFRWSPLPIPTKPTDFINGLITIAVAGNQPMHQGGAIHLYAINTSMNDTYFYNADGELCIVPQEGALRIKTEFGLIEIRPQEIAVIPRGVRFQIELKEKYARGYMCENYGVPFGLPERGPIGANGLAEERHFQIPRAWYENKGGNFSLIAKFNGKLWKTKINHSPLDVVAWHGNYAPYKYDLTLFNPVWSVYLDHSDPSIFTVMTSPTHQTGVANIDFVIFPPRWMVTEESFRPPYFHRNIMNEYMGLIYGKYDSKATGFVPGGGSLHNCMSGHGPDAATYEKAIIEDLKPNRYKDTLTFMFESVYVWQVTEFGMTSDIRQKDYLDCWKGLEPSSRFA